MSPNSASASQAGAHIPHAGKPLPGGKLKPAPWWAGIGQRWVYTVGCGTNHLLSICSNTA